MDIKTRMAQICYPGATGWWPEYLATRAYYYVDRQRDTFMIGDEAAMLQILRELR